MDIKDKDPKVVIREPDGKVIGVVNEKQIQDTLKSLF
jgi:hypothetical protein